METGVAFLGAVTVSPTGSECYNGVFRPIAWTSPQGVTLPNRYDIEGQEIVGYILGMETKQDRQGTWVTYPIMEELLAVVTIPIFQEFVQSETPAGVPVTTEVRTSSPAGVALQELFARGPASGRILTVCGPTYSVAGLPYVQVDTWRHGPDPAATARPIITVEGPLSVWRPIGTTQAWPKVGDYVVSSSQGEPGSISFGQAWNRGDLQAGAVIWIRGHADTIRGADGVIPIEWVLREPGTEPIDPGPGKVDLPDEPPPEDPEMAEPDPWFGDPADLEDLEDTGEDDPTEFGDGNGELLPPGNGIFIPGDNGAPEEVGPSTLRAGFGGTTGLVILGLLLFPLLLGRDKER